MNFITNEARIRVRIVDAVKIFVNSIEEIESKYQEIDDVKELPFEIISKDNDAARLEKAMFLLSIIHSRYVEMVQDESAFTHVAYSTYDMFSTWKIKRSLKKQGFASKFEFINSRLKHYTLELKLLKEMEHPHSGNITKYWYSEPLSASAEFDKDIAHLMFFTNLIFPDIETRIVTTCEKIINRFSSD